LDGLLKNWAVEVCAGAVGDGSKGQAVIKNKALVVTSLNH
jgi:hypothetical protein